MRDPHRIYWGLSTVHIENSISIVGQIQNNNFIEHSICPNTNSKVMAKVGNAKQYVLNF